MQAQSVYGLNSGEAEFGAPGEATGEGSIPESGMAALLNEPFGIDQGLQTLQNFATGASGTGYAIGSGLNQAGFGQASPVAEISALLGEISRMLPGLMNASASDAGQCDDGSASPCGSLGNSDGYAPGGSQYCDPFGNEGATPGQSGEIGEHRRHHHHEYGMQGALGGNQGGQTRYTNFSAGSVGDPHDSFSGTTSGGASVSNHWDSMQPHGDLLSSNSFRGGYQISAQTTQPGANGVTMNGQVDVRTNFGANDISYNAGGQAGVDQNGTWTGLTPGMSMTLGDGTTVSDGANNTLTIGKTNDRGGSIQTVLSANGDGGVDVQTSGTNIGVGGYLADQGNQEFALA